MLKKTLPFALAFVSALTIIVCVFFDLAPALVEEMDKWFILSGAFVCCIGLVNLVTVHTRNIKRRGRDWDLSYVLLFITFGYLVLGVVTGPTHPLYAWIFDATAVPLGATFYSVLSFYIVSAAYRAFRAKTRDAAILLISGIIVLLGNAPIGEVIYPGFGAATKWIMDIANTAAMRAVIFGATIGSFITAIRVFFGIDRPYTAAGE
jgi:membrane protein YdbS with pleckstrin-like domain